MESGILLELARHRAGVLLASFARAREQRLGPGPGRGVRLGRLDDGQARARRIEGRVAERLQSGSAARCVLRDSLAPDELPGELDARALVARRAGALEVRSGLPGILGKAGTLRVEPAQVAAVARLALEAGPV